VSGGHHILACGFASALEAGMRELNMAGVRITVLSRSRQADLLASGEHPHRAILVGDDATDSAWVETAGRIHAHDPFTAMMCFEDDVLPASLLIAKSLGFAWHTADTISATMDKAEMRARLHAAGLDDTPYQRVGGPAELARFVAELDAPVIVKPPAGSGSRNVIEVAGAVAAEAAWRAVAPKQPSTMLAERRLDGPLLTVEAFTDNGEHAILGSTRTYFDPEGFVELGHVSPTGLGQDVETEIGQLARDALDALGVRSGPTHTEIILTANGPRIVETHLRAAGDHIPLLVGDVTGRYVLPYMFWQAMGADRLVVNGRVVRLAKPVTEASAIWFFAAGTTGVVGEVRGESTIAGMPGVVDHAVQVRIGSRIRPPASSDDRLGYVRCHGESPAAAARRAQAAAAALRVLVDGSYDPYRVSGGRQR
jgi:biotin carboxylase